MGWGTAFSTPTSTAGSISSSPTATSSGRRSLPALGETYAQASQLLLNQGGTFRDVSAGAGRGLQTPRVSRGLAVGDLDDDGDPDLVLSNMDAAAGAAREPPADRAALDRVPLARAAGNRLAIGATVTVTSGGRTQTREVRSGGSYLSQSDLRPLFGLGDAAGPVSVEVPDAWRRPLVVAGSAGGPPAHARADGDRPPMTARVSGSLPSPGLLSISSASPPRRRPAPSIDRR